MNEELFYLFSSIGIGLTFICSVAAIIVSIVSLKQTNKVTEHIGYLNTISTNRYKWSMSLREYSSMYFKLITKLCCEQGNNVVEVYNEFVHYHFAISLMLFENDINLQDKLDKVKQLAWGIVCNSKIIDDCYKKYSEQPGVTKEHIERQAIVIETRKKINNLKCLVIDEYQDQIFRDIRELTELEWRKQQNETGYFK